LHLLRFRRKSPVRRRQFFQAFTAYFPKENAHEPARSGWISSPAGQGFMSTQRREDRLERRVAECAGGLSQLWLGFLAWFVRAFATVGTAPPQDSAAWLATNSLQSDYRTMQPVRQQLRHTSRSSPPIRAGRRASPGAPTTRRSSSRFTPTPSVLELLHPFRSQTPAGERRWTERYDGKRNLYFQHAA